MNILFFLTPKSEVAYLYEDYSLRQALEKMEHHRYSAVPIINRKGNYVGTITEGDMLWNVKDKYLLDLHKAEEIPLTQIKRRWYNDPVNVNCEIEDLVMTSMNQNFVPVIDDNQTFIGIIKRKDIIQYCYNCYKGKADKIS
ncbi:CBS domain-containing protein [uncultured Robinsoniella sp.]|uniref:CBS domain-containing protein n=1 Tax=uncultured Robinsoniella sp. TaxID=904190 RepID=UPI00374EF34E